MRKIINDKEWSDRTLDGCAVRIKKETDTKIIGKIDYGDGVWVRKIWLKNGRMFADGTHVGSDLVPIKK